MRKIMVVLVFFGLLVGSAVVAQEAKTPMQQAAPFVDTLGARLAKLVREVEAAPGDFAKVRELNAAYLRSNEKLNGQLDGFVAQMDEAGRKEYGIYFQMRMGKLPGRLAAALEKANAAAAARAAAAGPEAIARWKASVAKLVAEADALGAQYLAAGADNAKSDLVWKATLAWDTKRHELLHAVRKDADIASPETLLDEAEGILQPRLARLDRLRRLMAQPPCPTFQAELKAIDGRVDAVLSLEPAIRNAKTQSALDAAVKQRELAANAALAAIHPELTADEAAEIQATTQALLDTASRKLDEAIEKAGVRLRKSE